MSEFTLYSYYRSSCSYRVRIALHYKSLDFTYKPIHLLKEGGEQFKDSYKILNPFSQVPCLKHGDKVLAQSLPILLYLEEFKKDPPLLPKDSFKKAEILSFCEMINSGIQPLQNLSLLNHISEHFKADKLKWSGYWINRGLKALEDFLKEKAGSFCFSNDLTLADLFLIPQIYNAKRFQVDMSLFPVLNKIDQFCLEKSFFKKALPENQPDSP